MTEPPPDWLRDPALAPLWTAARSRLERNGVQPRGVLVVPGLDRAGRHAVGGLLGRPVVSDRPRVDLAAVDAALRGRSGIGGLVSCLDRLGGPVRNRAGERSAAARARELPYDRVREWLAGHPDVAAGGWIEPWLEGVRRSGVLVRAGGDAASPDALVRALRAVQRLSSSGGEPVARTQLAAGSLGDAHALDDGTLVGHLVLRALAASEGSVGAPVAAAERRALWDRHGVRADSLSSTCLTLGLRPRGRSALERRLRDAATAGDPVHVTAWDLERGGLHVAESWVLVCENPRVLEAVAQQRGADVPVVCTSGVPGLVTLETLRLLAAAGARLGYHGDFDWPGVAIANRLTGIVGCRPWRMAEADYRKAARPDGLALHGQPVQPRWDPALGVTMVELGTAVHEEAVVDEIVAELPTLGRRQR